VRFSVLQDWLLRLSACLLVAIEHDDGPGIDSVARISHVKGRRSVGNVVRSGKSSVQEAQPAFMYGPSDKWEFNSSGSQYALIAM